MMKKTKLIRSCVMALFVLVALLLVYLAGYHSAAAQRR